MAWGMWLYRMYLFVPSAQIGVALGYAEALFPEGIPEAKMCNVFQLNVSGSGAATTVSTCTAMTATMYQGWLTALTVDVNLNACKYYMIDAQTGLVVATNSGAVSVGQALTFAQAVTDVALLKTATVTDVSGLANNSSLIFDTSTYRGALALGSLLAADSTIYLRGGTYDASDLVVTIGGTSGHPIVIKPYNGETVTFKPSSACNYILHFASQAYLRFEDIDFDGGKCLNAALKFDGTAHDITILRGQVHNAVGLISGTYIQGVLIASPCQNITLDGVHLHHNGNGVNSHFEHGVYLHGGVGHIVRNCEADHNGSHGIQAYDGDDADTYTLEKNCTHDNGERGIGAYYGIGKVRNNVMRREIIGLSIQYTPINIAAAFNTIEACTTGVFVSEIARTTAVLDLVDTVVLNGTTGIQVTGPLAAGAALHVHYCLTNGNTTNIRQSGDQTGVTLDHNLTSAFTPNTDDGGANLKPTSGNPAIGAGLAVSGLTTDMGGNTRANPPTMGAWE